MMSGTDIQPLVIDVGTFNTKAGFAGDDAPRSVFSTLIDGVNPIQNGSVTNWAALEKIYHIAFYKELKVAPEEHPILLAESPFTSQTDREKTVQMMFEKFNVPALDILPDAVLAVYAAGRVTGLVVDLGNDSARIVPVVEGKVLSQTIEQVHLGGLATGIVDVIQSSDESLQGALANNIILSGGGNLTQGLVGQLHDEITALGSGASVNFINPEHRETSVWLGGTLVASSSTFQDQWMSNEQYDESGAGGLNGKYYA